MNKIKKKKMWYSRGRYKSVIFVPATPNSQLQKLYQEQISGSAYKIRVVEGSGKSVKSYLQVSDPFSDGKCNRRDCMICSSDGKGPCLREGVTYSIQCTQCAAVYIGESANNAYSRGVEHLAGIRSEREEVRKNSPLWRHARESHAGVMPEYRMSVTGIYHNDTMMRQIAENVKINRQNNVINNKTEYNLVRIPRVAIQD